jgi:hypothetical protein
MSKRFLAVDFTDGHTKETFLFDGNGDTEQSVALFSDRMRENGWVPMKGSQRLLVRENGVLQPFIDAARKFTRRVWKLA